jgi:HAMP domain-containing protein
MKTNRRQFISRTALAAMGSLGIPAWLKEVKAGSVVAPFPGAVPMVISTWNHGYEANEAAWKVLESKGQPALSEVEAVEMDAMNQYTHKVTRVVIPKMMIGDEWVGKNSAFEIPSPIVDEVKGLVGGTVTIFQLINGRDMLRVCTNVETKNKTRAIGTYIPAVNPDGTENPVVKTLLSGRTYYGKAYVVNAWYLTTYQPIFDRNNQIIGALYFGIRQEKSKALREGLKKIVVGKNGYVFVLDQEGNYIISGDGTRDGKYAMFDEDSDGNAYIQDIINKAKKLKAGEVVFKRYNIDVQRQIEPQTEVAAITYFEPWGWIVNIVAVESDFKQITSDMQSSIYKIIIWGCVSGAVVTGMILIVSVFLSGKITQPIVELTTAAKKISKGNLDVTIDIKGDDEIGKLAAAFKLMQFSMGKLMQNTQKRKR